MNKIIRNTTRVLAIAMAAIPLLSINITIATDSPVRVVHKKSGAEPGVTFALPRIQFIGDAYASPGDPPNKGKRKKGGGKGHGPTLPPPNNPGPRWLPPGELPAPNYGPPTPPPITWCDEAWGSIPNLCEDLYLTVCFGPCGFDNSYSWQQICALKPPQCPKVYKCNHTNHNVGLVDCSVHNS